MGVAYKNEYYVERSQDFIGGGITHHNQKRYLTLNRIGIVVNGRYNMPQSHFSVVICFQGQE